MWHSTKQLVDKRRTGGVGLTTVSVGFDVRLAPACELALVFSLGTYFEDDISANGGASNVET